MRKGASSKLNCFAFGGGLKKSLLQMIFKKTSRPVSPLPQEAARRAEKEAEERRQKEQEEPAILKPLVLPTPKPLVISLKSPASKEVKRLAELEKAKDNVENRG